MTESTDDTTTNSSPSDCDSDDYLINRFPLTIDQHEHFNDEFGLFNNDDDDEDNLTLFDLKSTQKSDHDLSIFDELAHQCNAVLLATSSQQNTPRSANTFNLPTTTMINDYERRFQRSLQKLSVPSWYNDTHPSPKLSPKPPIVSTTHYKREIHRTPEIVHVHRPHSYRSCRSSLGTSPSPSVHSWHPNLVIDGMNFSPLLPSSSSSSRRSNKYEKGIERVTKSSHWYRPTQFAAAKKSDQISTSKIPMIEQEKSNYDHYDQPKLSSLEQILNSIKKPIPRIAIQRQANCLIDDIDFDDVENTNSIKQNNDYHKGDISMTYDKQYDNEIPIMPLAKENTSFASVELEEVTDEEENDKRSTTNTIPIPSAVKQNDDETNTSLERLANHLVDSIITDVLLSKNLEHDETNLGVRELSDDENALRELDENDMSGTDEFILFATKAELSSDEENREQESTNQNDNNQVSPTINRGSTNRLYTFSRTNDDGTINNSKKLSSNQDSSTSVLMIVDKDISPTDSHVNQMVDLDNDQSKTSLPVYRSHIQKRQINLGRYYDGMMRAKSSQLPTHDLRCNLFLYQPPILSEGVTEETVRKGRILLDQIPNAIELKNQINESTPNMPVRSILKNTRFSSVDETENEKIDEPILKIEESELTSPRKVTTTITEEYHRIQRKIIEEFDKELKESIQLASDYSHNQERVTNQQSLIPSVPRIDQSPYELLSECYSGYSFMRNKYSLPVKSPLTPNVSSIQTTTDEAYESETTASPRSPTMSSSTAATLASPTANIHPDLEHEFEYPVPPPPVPDRRLKPPHLRPPPPPTKPRYHKQQNDSAVYSKIQKQNKPSPLTAIRHLLAPTSDNPDFSNVRTLSSRHYCGSIPSANEPLISSASSSSETRTRTKTTQSSQQNSKTRSLSGHDNQQIKFRKSSTSSLTKTKSKKSSSAYFDETTNGLAIRLPASQFNEPNATNKQNPNRSSTSSSSGKRTDGTTKYRPLSENLNQDRSSNFETSV